MARYRVTHVRIQYHRLRLLVGLSRFRQVVSKVCQMVAVHWSRAE